MLRPEKIIDIDVSPITSDGDDVDFGVSPASASMSLREEVLRKSCTFNRGRYMYSPGAKARRPDMDSILEDRVVGQFDHLEGSPFVNNRRGNRRTNDAFMDDTSPTGNSMISTPDKLPLSDTVAEWKNRFLDDTSIIVNGPAPDASIAPQDCTSDSVAAWKERFADDTSLMDSQNSSMQNFSMSESFVAWKNRVMSDDVSTVANTQANDTTNDFSMSLLRGSLLGSMNGFLEDSEMTTPNEVSTVKKAVRRSSRLAMSTVKLNTSNTSKQGYLGGPAQLSFSDSSLEAPPTVKKRSAINQNTTTPAAAFSIIDTNASSTSSSKAIPQPSANATTQSISAAGAMEEPSTKAVDQPSSEKIEQPSDQPSTSESVDSHLQIPDPPEEYVQFKTAGDAKASMDRAVRYLEAMALRWERKNESSVPEAFRGEAAAAVGKARLLATSKIKQFADLVQRSENGEKEGGFPIGVMDLQGFWELVMIQILKVKEAFETLETMESQGWLTKSPRKSQRKKPKTFGFAVKRPRLSKGKPVAAKSKLGDLIKAKRAAMAEEATPVAVDVLAGSSSEVPEETRDIEKTMPAKRVSRKRSARLLSETKELDNQTTAPPKDAPRTTGKRRSSKRTALVPTTESQEEQMDEAAADEGSPKPKRASLSVEQRHGEGGQHHNAASNFTFDDLLLQTQGCATPAIAVPDGLESR
ncbi:unnamed protein product [Cyprideis torosa]|uniref:Uncharacterized protein n=1 Tax=Cyprideis torosa TaxID=163714 RepID=A0A7R8WAH2_9CRUS|nr:unnamed protein product [Cyprideis torosa]CAG0885855.1 unnamed protein product [Cyprideis torosa]